MQHGVDCPQTVEPFNFWRQTSNADPSHVRFGKKSQVCFPYVSQTKSMVKPQSFRGNLYESASLMVGFINSYCFNILINPAFLRGFPQIFPQIRKSLWFFPSFVFSTKNQISLGVFHVFFFPIFSRVFPPVFPFFPWTNSPWTEAATSRAAAPAAALPQRWPRTWRPWRCLRLAEVWLMGC